MVKSASKPSNRSTFSVFALVVASFLLIAGFSFFLLEKTGVTNIYTKPVSEPAQEPVRPVNSVDYSPASTTEKTEGEAIKDKAIEQANKPAAAPSTITVTLSAAGQDVKGGPVIVRSIVNGATTGTCKLTLLKGGLTKTYQSNVIMLGTYYGCEGFSVPVSDLNTGIWKLTLVATSSGAEGTASQDVQVTL